MLDDHAAKSTTGPRKMKGGGAFVYHKDELGQCPAYVEI